MKTEHICHKRVGVMFETGSWVSGCNSLQILRLSSVHRFVTWPCGLAWHMVIFDEGLSHNLAHVYHASQQLQGFAPVRQTDKHTTCNKWLIYQGIVRCFCTRSHVTIYREDSHTTASFWYMWQPRMRRITQ